MKSTKRLIGIWIDHRQAVVVTLAGGYQTCKMLECEVPERRRLGGGSRSSTPYGPQDTVSETSNDRRYEQQLRRFYQRVTAELQGADEIVIFGPGEARTELRSFLREDPALRTRITATLAADKLSWHQIAERTRSVLTETDRSGRPASAASPTKTP